MASKIKQPHYERGGDHDRRTKLPEANINKCKVAFSLCYLNEDHGDFLYSRLSKDDYIRLIQTLKDFCCLKWGEVKQNPHKFHAHDVVFSKPSHSTTWNKLPENIRDFIPFQFKIYKEFRIVGFFNSDNVFEIVWFDRSHSLYERR